MTDKQIIIDGVDVSGCEHFEPCTKYTCEISEMTYCCEEEPNCYYKQLKRKEQEYEALNKVAKTHLAETFEMQKEIDQLKAELQATKGLVTAIGKENFGLIQEQNEIDKKIDKYEIALQEIKEIAEKGHKERGNLMRTWWFKDILQKINEVENV